LFTLTDSVYNTGTINSVKIYSRCKYGFAGASSCQFRPIVVKTEGTIYNPIDWTNSAAWANWDYTYTTNPNTGVAWTWAEITALQVGFEGSYNGIDDTRAGVTQMYVEVNFTPTW